jgi:hypothetical protein
MEIPVFTDGITITGDGTEAHPLATLGGGVPAAPDKSVQFNSAGAFGGSPALIFDTTPGAEELVLDFTADLAGSDFTVIANSASLNAGTTSAMKVDVGSTTPDMLQIVNAEPASAGILIKDTGGGGVQIQSDVEVDISSDTAAPITIAIGNGTDLLGFFGAGGIAQPTVAGAKLPGDAVMASLLTALAALGLIIDTTT